MYNFCKGVGWGGKGRAGDNYSAPCEIKLSRIERCRVAVLLNSCARAKSSSLFKKQAVIQCRAASKLSAPIRLQVCALPSAIPGAYGPTVMKKAGRELAVRFA